MRPPLALLILSVLAVPAAADPPKSSNASRYGRRAQLEDVFWKVADASKDPEFLVWYDGPPISEELRFEFSDTDKSIGFSCEPYGTVPGNTPALAVFCQGTPVVAFGTGIFTYGVNKDQWAVTAGHEVAHLLFKHGEKRQRLHDRSLAAWRKDWLAGPAGQKWKGEALRQINDAAEASGLKIGPETMLGVLEVKFLESPGGQAYLETIREQEAEADQWGARLATVAGFNSAAGYALYKRLMEEKPASSEISMEPHYPPDIRAYELKVHAEPGSLWIPPTRLTTARKTP